MPKPRKLRPQSVWDLVALQSALDEAEVSKAEHHAIKLLSYLIRNPTASWHDVPHLPKAAIACLEQHFVKFTISLLAIQRSDDGETMKLLLRLQDGLRIEAVVMQYDTRETDPDTGNVIKGNLRATLCVSSQVGCQMGCTFCATGALAVPSPLTS
jgi:adenine C2-methylase RlmN of 23S rRNA A2503 and tRNA A37